MSFLSRFFRRKEETKAAEVVNWKYVKRIDPITDENTSYIQSITSYIILLPGHNIRSHSTLSIGRSGDELQVTLGLRDYLTTDTPVSVSYRFDSLPPVLNQIWESRRFHVQLPQEEVKPFLDKACNAHQLVVRIHYPARKEDYIFYMDNLNHYLSLLGAKA